MNLIVHSRRSWLLKGPVAVLLIGGLPAELPCSRVLGQSEASSDELRRGDELARAGRLSEALQAYDRFRQLAPADPRSYVASGRALIAAGRLEDARNELQHVVNLELTRPDDAIALARALDSLGWGAQASEALAPFEKSADLKSEGLWLLADLYHRLHRSEDALRVAGRLAARSPNDVRVHILRGQIHLAREDSSQALVFFEKAVGIDESDAEAQYGLGLSRWLVQGTEDAKIPLLKAAELNPEDWNPLSLLAIISSKFGDRQESIGYLERAAKLAEAPAQIFFDLGNTYRQIGEREKARAALGQYQRRYSNEEAKSNRASIVEQLLNQGRQQISEDNPQAAISSFERVTATEPDNWEARSFIAKIYLSSPKPELAMPHIERMLEINPDNSEGSFLMAFYLHQRRDYAAAIGHAERARELLPGNPELRNLLGNLYVAVGRRQEAVQEYRAAMNLVPDNPIFRLNHDSIRKRLP